MNSDNRQKTLAALNDLWQGNPIRRTGAGDGHSTLYGCRMAVHLMVQPRVARTFMADRMAAETGFLPRFLISEPPSTIGRRKFEDTNRDDMRLRSFADRLRAILARPMPMDPETRELQPRVLPLAPEARALLIGFADSIEAAQAPGGSLAHVTGYASKAAEQAARLAGVLTLWRDLDALEVTLTDMGNGIDLAQYYLSEAMRLADAANTSEEIDRALMLCKWLEAWPHPEILTSDVVQRGPNQLREGGTLEDRPRYNKSRCFDPFPFPDLTDDQRTRLRSLGEELDAHRKRQQAAHPKLTLTQMYNVLEKLKAGETIEGKDKDIYDQGLVGILKDIHERIDAAVADAYGWPVTLTDEEILTRLVDLNHERAAEEAAGHIRWLRPDYQNPTGKQAGAKGTQTEMDVGATTSAAKAPWPKTLPDQIAAVREALQTTGEATPEQIARKFARARANSVKPLLESLAALGQATALEDGRYAA